MTLVENDYHLMIIVDFETAETFMRTEAVKIIKKYMELSPMTFPIEFAGSLAAVASHDTSGAGNPVTIIEGDMFRLVSLEILRSLASTNYMVVAHVNGFKVLYVCIRLFSLSLSFSLIQTHIQTNMHTYIHIYIHTHSCTHAPKTHVYVHLYLYIYHSSFRASAHTSLYVYMMFTHEYTNPMLT